jgi:Cft2 family RNA processing exonuclease/dsRNA-specific ribonuclease
MTTVRPEIELTFLGGAGAIGASCALVRVAGTSLLVDCGVRFRAEDALPDLDALTGRTLDAIVVTHAHSDHTGGLPVVHEAFPDTPVYLTPPTLDLVGILQRDALKIMSSSEREDDIPLYNERQTESLLRVASPVHHHASVTVGEVCVTFLPASHILGASMVHLQTPGGNVLFTGDYCVTPQKTVDGLQRPALPVDLIVSESTYGDRLHADRRIAEARFVRTVAEILARGGRVLVPAFAIGRAQEVLVLLRDALRKGQIPQVPVFVDGMVRSVCGVYARHEPYVTRALAREIRSSRHPFYTGSIRPVSRPDDRRAVLEAGPCVIVASSGMLRGGPSAFYAAEMAKRAEDAILITGYQDEESPGRALLSLANQQGPRTLRLGEKEIEVRCRFETYSLSAHADRMQMVGLIEALAPETVVLVHGDPEAKRGLARSLGDREVALAGDGDQIVRTLRGQPSSARPRRSALPDRRIAALLVGPATGEPLRAATLAAAWAGRTCDAREIERFVEALVEAGAVRRDEEDPTLLWSLVGAPRPEVLDEHDERAQALKADNPKGRLLELCQRQRLPAPTRTETSDGGAVVVELLLVTDRGPLASGPHTATSKRLAEQLAAHRLLELLEQLGQSGASDGNGEVVVVSEERAEALRQENPKGRLLELSMHRGGHGPAFDIRGALVGFVGRGVLTTQQGALVSKTYSASRAKIVEQAASAELLQVVLQQQPAQAPVVQPGPPSRDPRMTLNEMRQLKLVRGFGYELVERRGPPHQPVFVIRGWIERPDGERVFTERAEARTRKEGEAAVAPWMVALAVASSGAVPG